MSLKAELETWAAALKAYDEEDFEKSLELFSQIADSSKILCNMGLIHATLGDHEAAVERFLDATNLDQYLAVAYFQCGVSNFLLEHYELAYKDFDEALLYLRGNQAINYEQLGLNFRLYSAEVLFNKGLSLVYMGQVQQGLADMEEGRREKATDEHNVIDDAISDRGEGYTVFSIPVGVLYRPSEKKLKNSVTRDYLGKAKLVASSDPIDDITAFSGAARLKLGISPSGIFLDRPDLRKDLPTMPRSATFSTGRSLRNDVPKSAIVERANTSPFERKENNTAAKTPSRDYTAMGVTRSNTQITPARASPNATVAVIDSSLRKARSIRQPNSANSVSASPPVPPKETYDDVTNRRASSSRSSSLTRNTDRNGPWSRSNVSRSPTSRSASQRRHAPSSSVSSLRRKPGKLSIPTYEDEEGYVSGEHDDSHEMTLIRIKIHYQGDVRGMTMTPEITFTDFLQKVCSKFKKRVDELDLKFTDEDGGKITLRDESDFEMAIETAREQVKSKSEGKLELWCVDHRN